ncbi:MAG: hypothetical protein COT74_03235 [Bdellovibrionales bacterium CG10_big_fil_rev_8_21_14_0_10_45_34]|nr:MAG: hypothetical protein COT74_03235 [Bdellovibrionales bacterium CG10_big_fil_rev_8_21_14_0_10_45_34]
MKLYYTKGACSVAAHIALEHSGLLFELKEIAKDTPQEQRDRFIKLNSKHKVPTLELSPGSVVTENPAVLMYIASQSKVSIVPSPEELAPHKLIEILSFAASEVHPPFSFLFHPDAYSFDETNVPHIKSVGVKKITNSFSWVESQISGKFYFGDDPSIVDFYLFIFYRWAQVFKIPIEPFQKFKTLFLSVLALDSTHRALTSEGLSHWRRQLEQTPSGSKSTD